MFVFLVLSSVLVAQLFSIQVLKHQEYKALAESQHWGHQYLPTRRGSILSSDGFPLATNQTRYFLYAEPKKIVNVSETATALAQVLETTSEKFEEIMNLDLMWVVAAHRITPQDKELIEKLALPGLGFEEEPVRIYPEETLAAHVLGYVASNEGGGETGYFGIEGEFDGDLKGKLGRIIEERDAAGDPILVGEYMRIDPIDGRDVVLTINRAVQYLVEKRLKEGVTKYQATSGSVIVMDPFTGDIIALANFPTYDPGDFSDLSVSEEAVFDDELPEKVYAAERKNLAIAETYEPGSVMKALTISAGVDLEKINANTTFEDKGPVTYSGHTIDNWDGKHHGLQTITQLLQKSNNIGAAWVGHLIGAKSLHAYLLKFGLGEATKVELEGEDTGMIRNYKEWKDIDLATAAFGQGISATPLQVLNVFNVIANGGNLMRPRVVSKIVEGEKVINMAPKKVRRVVAKGTADLMVEMLTAAVEGGESKYFNIDKYNVAGKTGTAQIAVAGEYDPEKTNATFAGFLPTSKKFSMIVRLKEPESSVFASETAVPLWMEIAEDLVRYYGIPPDKKSN